MRKLFLIFIMLVAFVATTLESAQADHCLDRDRVSRFHGPPGRLCIYWAQDLSIDRQPNPSPYLFNYVARKWGLSATGEKVTWYAPDDPAPPNSVRNLVEEGISLWAAGVPKLNWQRVTDQGQADLVFKHVKCEADARFVDCQRFDSAFYDTDRKAYYWTKATIWIDNQIIRTRDVKKAAVVHEMGHMLGLHERYYLERYSDTNPTAQCNGQGPGQGDYTIMDAFYPLNMGSFIEWFHCDSRYSPTPEDDTRVANYWTWGVFENFTSRADPIPYASHGVFEWNDHAWAEEKHVIRFYWLASNGQWVQYYKDGAYYSRPVTDNIGVHWQTEVRTIRTDLYTGQFPGLPTGGTYHMACGEPYFIASGAAGETRCTAPYSLYLY